MLRVKVEVALPRLCCMEGERAKGRDSSFASRMFKPPPGYREDIRSTNE